MSRNADFARLWLGESVSAIGSRRKRAILVAANVARAVLLGLIALLALLGILAMGHLLVIGFALGACAVPFEVAYQSYVPRLVDRGDLVEANSKVTASTSIAEIGGPGLVGLFPRRPWIRAVERALRGATDAALDYGDHRGRIELRIALSDYLARVRGVRVDPSRIVVTQGFTQALDLLCRVLVARGAQTLAMETPSHPGLWATVRRSGLTLVGCPVDVDGLRTGELARCRADAVVVAPAHQFPTGAVLAPARRAELIDWAGVHDGLVIEDDYDAEFRYDRTAVGAVQGLDPGRVAHVGSASKTLAPGVRLGWISAPPDLVDELRDHKSAADSGSPAVDQLALAELLSRGDYERHIVRARHAYRRRRDRLVSALRSRLPALEISGAAAGMQLLLMLPDGVDDLAIADAARSRGIGVSALSLLHLTPSRDRGLLLGYGRLSEPSIEEAVAVLSSVIAASLTNPVAAMRE